MFVCNVGWKGLEGRKLCSVMHSHAQIYKSSGDLNSGPHTYTASTLSTEPSPQLSYPPRVSFCRCSKLPPRACNSRYFRLQPFPSNLPTPKGFPCLPRGPFVGTPLMLTVLSPAFSPARRYCSSSESIDLYTCALWPCPAFPEPSVSQCACSLSPHML